MRVRRKLRSDVRRVFIVVDGGEDGDADDAAEGAARDGDGGCGADQEGGDGETECHDGDDGRDGGAGAEEGGEGVGPGEAGAGYEGHETLRYILGFFFSSGKVDGYESNIHTSEKRTPE